MRGSRTSGSEGGPRKPTSREAGRAPRSDPYTEHRTREGKVYCAVVLDAYRRLAVLRRTVPALTDPSFTHVACTADEGTRVFTLRRGEVLLAVNFGTVEQTTTLDTSYDEVLFATPGGVTLAGSTLTLPAHSGCLLG